ncbi:MAG: hypothetical protein EA411_11770 [Saprospirales bacterium]|nr:MAG: hypothetical protein EA411_11770 [Saprospirales bacterium]
MDSMTHSNIQNIGLTGFAALLLWIHYQFFHSGYFGYDELQYTELAAQVLSGDFSHELNLFAYRWSIILPLALFYSLFGIGDFANMLPSMIALLLIVFLVLDLMKQYGVGFRILAVLFLVCSAIHLMYLVKPMPDLLVELGFLICFLGWYGHNYRGKSAINSSLSLVGGGIFIFLAKESFLILYPFFLALLIYDLRAGKKKKFWALTIGGLLAFLCLYFLYFWFSTGNPIIRVDALFHDRYISECTYEYQPIEVLLRRVLYEMWLSFIRFGALISLGFLILLHKSYRLPAAEKFILVSYAGVLLLSNFMTISYSSYVPLCDDVRHFLFVYPIAAAVLIIGFSRLEHCHFWPRLFIAFTMVFQWYLTTSFFLENYTYIYLPIAAGVLFWGKFNSKLPWGLLVAAGLFYPYLSSARYHQVLNFSAQKELLEYVLEQETPIIVVTDPSNARIGRFYAGYNENDLVFLSFAAYAGLEEPVKKPVYFISNGMTAYHSNINWDTVPSEIIKAPSERVPLKENTIGAVYLISD